MVFALAVIGEPGAAECLDQGRLRRRAGRRWRRACCGDGVLERREGDAGVAAGPACELFDELRFDVRLRPGEPALGVFECARRIVARSSGGSGSRTTTRQRERSAALTSNDGFSVVAPISVIVPSSTAPSSASCCALLKRWISSMKRIVRLPRRWLFRASSIAARTSFTPASTAEMAMNSAPLCAATNRARVVFPEPGGPQRISDDNLPAAACRSEQRLLADQICLADELFKAAQGACVRQAAHRGASWGRVSSGSSNRSRRFALM